MGEGLLVQGDLPRGPARPAVGAGAAHRRPVRQLPEHLPRPRSAARGPEEDALPPGEIGKWTEQAERLGRALTASALAARHATSREVAWLFRHALMGSLGDPPPSADPAQAVGHGRDRAAVRGRGAQRPHDAPDRAVRGRLVRGVPVVRPVPRPDAVPRRRAVAALRRLAAVPGGDQLPDAPDPAGQGVARTWRASSRTPATWTRTSARRARRRRSRWPSRSPPPACSSTASPRSGCRSCTAGTG